MKSRVILLFIFIVSLFSVVWLRVFYLQAMPQEKLARLEKSQYQSKIFLLPQRGKILDRSGEELATSMPAYSLYADPAIIQADHSFKGRKKLASKLAALTGLSTQEIFDKINWSEKRFVWLKRQLDVEVKEKIKALGERGLAFVEEKRRIYPNYGLASSVLGMVGIDGDGLEGLEKTYDAELRGEKISIQSRKDAHGRPLLQSGKIFETANDGATLETTLDKDIQYQLEKELHAVREAESAQSATGIVMDPQSGEILAMAVASKDSTDRRNRAVTDLFEPGSTFKAVTIAAALKTGRIHPNTKYNCEQGKMKIGNRWIHEAEKAHKFGMLSLAEILEVSSNIGTTKIAQDVGEENFKKMIYDFGFGRPTGIDFIGESAGLIVKGKWNEHLLSNISFGHGVGVTAIQMATAYAIIANGGTAVRPYFVKRAVDSQGHEIQIKSQSESKQDPRRVLSQKEAGTLLLMLSGVTQDGGTGTLARIDGYPVAGKTGTAQKVNPDGRGYIKNAYISSFVGFVPANQPQFVIYILVDSPQKNYYGAQVAAPVFKKVASYALRKKGYLPVVLAQKANESKANPETAKASKIKSDDKLAALTNVPNFTGLTLRDISEEFTKSAALADKNWEVIGSGLAVNQFPQPGTDLKKVSKIKIYLQPVR